MCYTLHGSTRRNRPRNGADILMSYAVVRMAKMKSHDLKGMQFHNQRERESKTNPDIDEERSHENYDLANEENIDYNERVKEIIESQKTSTRKTRKDAVVVNELMITSDREFFDGLDPDEQKRFFEESYSLLSERYGEQNIAYAVVHNDEKTPHMHMGVVPMRDGRLQGKNVFNRQELLWLQDNFPKHMKEQGFELERGEKGSTREHLETRDFKKKMLEKEIDSLEENLAVKKSELSALTEKVPDEIKVPAKRQMKRVEVPTGEKSIFGREKMKTERQPTKNVILSEDNYKKLTSAAEDGQRLKGHVNNLLSTDFAQENKRLRNKNKKLEVTNKSLTSENAELKMDNNRLRSKISSLTNELENVYQTTKDFLKERTNGLQAFKEVLGSWVGRIKEKLPKSEIGRLHERSEAKEKTFDMNRVKELNKEAKKEKSVQKKKDMDLEL